MRNFDKFEYIAVNFFTRNVDKVIRIGPIGLQQKPPRLISVHRRKLGLGAGGGAEKDRTIFYCPQISNIGGRMAFCD